MYKHIGAKIQGITKFTCWLGIIASIIVGIYVGTDYDEWLWGISIIIGGFLVSWIGSWTLYGFGEMVEAAEKLLAEKPVAPIGIPQVDGTTQPIHETGDDMAAASARNEAAKAKSDHPLAHASPVHTGNRTVSETPVAPIDVGDGLIVCPNCNTKQQANRESCYKCGTSFNK